MGKATAVMLGILVGGHGLLGLLVEGEHLVNLFNVDIFIDTVHLLAAAALLIVGLSDSSPAVIRGVLLLFAGAYFLIGLLGLLDERIGGLLPTGLEPLDFLLLFGLGAAALLVGVLPSATRPLTTGGEPIN
jgi:hypothetical protein